MKKTLILFTGALVAACSLCTVSSSAQETLSEGEAVGLARKAYRSNTHLAEASRYAREARGRLAQWRDPELRLGYQNRSEESPPLGEDDRGHRSVQGFALRFFLPHPAETSASRQVGASRVAYFSALEASWAWDYEMLVRQAFYETLYRQRDVALTEQRVALRQQVRKEVQASSDAGVATSADVLRTSADLLDALTEQEKVRHNLEEARRELASLLSKPIQDLPPLQDTADLVLPEALTMTDLTAQAGLSHPLWKMFQAESDQVTAETRMARAERWPWFTFVQGGYSDINWDRDLDAGEWEVSTGIEIPLFSWIGDPGAESMEDWYTLQAEQSEALEELRADLSSALATYHAAGRFLAGNEESMALVQEIQEALETGATDLLPDPRRRADLQQRLLDRERQRLDWRRQRDQARLRVEALIGTPLAVPGQ